MKEENQFHIDARQEFKWLEQDYSFQEFKGEEKWYSDNICFRRNNIEVTIAFEWYDNMFSIYITRTNVPEKGNKNIAEILNPNNESKFNFTDLLFSDSKIDNKLLQPESHSDYKLTLKSQSQFLKEKGLNYLLGNDWPEFQDLSNEEIEFQIFERDENGKARKKETKKFKTIQELKKYVNKKK